MRFERNAVRCWVVCLASTSCQALAEEEKKSAAIMQAPLLELIDKFIALVSNPESVVPNRFVTASASPSHSCSNV